MKKLDTRNVSGPNAWGRTTHTVHTDYLVEPTDIGQEVPHWGGYQRPYLTIKDSDIGKVFVRITDKTDPKYVCWYEGIQQ